MKRTTLAILLVFSLVLTFSCKKDKEEEPKASLSLKYDGITWTPVQVTAMYASNMGVTQIVGAGTTLAEQLQLVVNGYHAGTYSLDTEDNNICRFGDYTSMFDDSPQGEIVITAYDSIKMTISGTFYFRGVTYEGLQKEFTEGKFDNVPLLIQ